MYVSYFKHYHTALFNCSGSSYIYIYNYGFHTNHKNPSKILSGLEFLLSFSFFFFFKAWDYFDPLFGEIFYRMVFPCECYYYCYKSRTKLLMLLSWKQGSSFDNIHVLRMSYHSTLAYCEHRHLPQIFIFL